MDINSLKENLSKSLADVSTKGIPSANFEPVWINNITRLNAQNFNSRMYPTIASYITGYGNAVFEGSNEQLSNLLSILPGYKVSDASTSEIHNIESDLSSTNDADGAYQAVFGIGNITQSTVTGQFLIGTYSNSYTDTLFAVGNGSDNKRSNALEVTLDGTLKSSKINVTDSITAKYVTLTQTITDSSNDKYAATKKYVFDKVKTESDRATTVENTLRTDLTKEINRATAAEQLLTTNLNNEITRATNAENLLTENLNTEINRAKTEEASIRAIASSAFHFKGSKSSYTELPKTGNTTGDVWQVGDKEYAWNGTEWVELGFNIDLSNYITQTELSTALNKKQDTITQNTDLTAKSLHTAETIRSNLSVEVEYTTGVYASLNARSLGFFSGGYGSSPEIFMNYISHVGTTPTTLNIKSNIQESDVGHRNIILTGISTPINDNDAVNKAYVDTNFQTKLVSETNIKSIKDDTTTAPQSLLGSGSLSFKTINNQSLLGSGNIDISGGGGTITVDAELSTTSTNPVQNSVITTALNGKQPLITNSSDITLSELHATNLYASTTILVQDIHIAKAHDSLSFRRQTGTAYGPVELTGVAKGTDIYSAVNVSQLNSKQDKFATLNSTNNSITLDTAYKSITGNGSSVIFTDDTNDLRLTSAGNIELNANKDVYISSTAPTIRSDYYNITWDSTDEAIVITFHE